MKEETSSIDTYLKAKKLSKEFPNNSFEDSLKIAECLEILKEDEVKHTLTTDKDTGFETTVAEFIAIAKSEGFTEIYHEQYRSGFWKNKEDFYIFFSEKEGILLVFNSYEGKTISSAYYYYNWQPNLDAKFDSYCQALGSRDKQTTIDLKYYTGGNSARGVLRMNLQTLRRNGKFLTPWLQRPLSLWLLNDKEEDKKSDDSDKINAKKISKFPESVQKAICPPEN